MLRSIKLSVDPVYIDPNSTLKHTGTSYQVSKTPNFSVAGNLILNINNNTTALTSYTFEYDIVPNQPLYVRTRYHFNTGTTSSWSNIIELSSNQVGLKSSDTVVSTPAIAVSFDYSQSSTGEVVITVENLALYSGIGNVTNVSWLVKSTDGVVLYELPHSSDITKELRLPISILNNEKSFVATAIAHTDTNVDSNIARTVGAIKSDGVGYFIATIRDTLYRNASNYLNITDPAGSYINTEIRIKSPDGTLIASYTGLDPNLPSFDVGNIDINGYYIIEVRAKTATGVYTPWQQAYAGGSSDYSPRLYANGIKYNTTRMGFGSYVNLNGMSTQSLMADEDNVFYMAIPETDTLEAYRISNGTIYPINKTFSMGVNELSRIPSLNYIRLYNGDVLIDHSMVSDAGNIEVPKFNYLKYNHATKQLSYVGKSMARHDERYGTGRTNSAVVTRDNLLYYVPGMMFDANGPVPLEMRVYDINQNKIVDHIPLPRNDLIQDVTISEDKYGNIFLFGGSGDYIKNATHNEFAATLLNPTIYKLDKIAKTWTVVHTPTRAVSSSYRYKMITMRDGNILIVDATPDLVSTAPRVSYIYNPYTNGNLVRINNNPTKEHLGISIETVDGDIGLMSSTPEIVESLSYVATTTSTTHVTSTVLSASQIVNNLVVPVGDTVYIRDPYRYASIDIQGTSMANTGKLVWIDGTTSTTLYYNDLIVTRNMTITTNPALPEPTYNRVIVVGDATLTLVQL